MYDDRAFIIDTTGTSPGECNGYYSVDLVEAFDQKTAKEKNCGQYDYHWPKKMPAIDRDLKMLQKISETDSNRDLDFDVWDALGDPYGDKGDNHHHCAIVKVTGDEHVRIWLERVWSHD
jgi:hypothetical protein